VAVTVDAHVHVWRALDRTSDPLRRDDLRTSALGPPPSPPFVTTIVSPHDDIPADLLAQYLDEHGVERAVLVQPVFRGEDNAYVADESAAAPDRHAAVCVVNPRRPNAAERLRYWTEERGCRGLRLRPRLAAEAASFGHPDTYPLWKYASEHGVVINVYAGPEHLLAIGALSARFPDVAVIVDHMANPDVSAGVTAPAFQDLLALARHPRVFVKVSGYYYFSAEAYPYRDCWDLFRSLYDAFGPARLIWGSDFPHVLLRSGYSRSVLLQERAYPFLSAGELDCIMGGNAADLYWGSK
jgi:predicted TIM-barrel fold metal-dependent hydrolase